jgi:hypothetical protein
MIRFHWHEKLSRFVFDLARHAIITKSTAGFVFPSSFVQAYGNGIRELFSASSTYIKHSSVKSSPKVNNSIILSSTQSYRAKEVSSWAEMI